MRHILPEADMVEQERRLTPRYSFIASAELVDAKSGTGIATRISELSLQGCYLDMVNPFPVGTIVLIKISSKTPGHWCGSDFPRRFTAISGGSATLAHTSGERATNAHRLIPKSLESLTRLSADRSEITTECYPCNFRRKWKKSPT
jgi:hypothetical protein